MSLLLPKSTSLKPVTPIASRILSGSFLGADRAVLEKSSEKRRFFGVGTSKITRSMLCKSHESQILFLASQSISGASSPVPSQPSHQTLGSSSMKVVASALCHKVGFKVHLSIFSRVVQEVLEVFVKLQARTNARAKDLPPFSELVSQSTTSETHCWNALCFLELLFVFHVTL